MLAFRGTASLKNVLHDLQARTCSSASCLQILTLSDW